MEQFKKNTLSGKTRNLLLVTFLTLTLTVLVFLVAVSFLDRNSRSIFTSVETIIEGNTWSSELHRLLLSIELDIRDLINVVLREPYRLTAAKQDLKGKFSRIQQVAEHVEAGPVQQKLIKQLRWYRMSLDRVLWDYGEVNSVLYEVYFYIDNIKKQLSYMEEVAGQILIELAMDDQNTDAIQQAYVLVNIAREKMLQLNVLVNSSIANNEPQFLVADEIKSSVPEEETAIGKVHSLTNTLRTLTAANESIADYALNIQQTIPLLEDNIFDLSVKFSNLNENYQLFLIERDNSMKVLDDLEQLNRTSVQSINPLMQKHSRNTLLMGWLISLAVAGISILGLMLTRRMSRQLELAAKEALLAREAGESLNLQLKQEIEGKRRLADDLARSRDELEARVKERTVELSSANRGLALEVEERKKAEFALASEKERLAVTLRSIGDGVITTDLDNRVLLINKVAEELTGWMQDEVVGRSLSEVFHIVDKQTREVCESPVNNLMQKSGAESLADDVVLIARDGSERDISNSCSAIRDKGSTVIGAVLVFRDVTEKKRMQDDALKSEKLKSVGILAGGIAHDFNNILAAILGNISLAKLQIDEGEKSNSRNLLEGAEKASLRAKNLTQQLLTFSKGGEPIKKVESVSEIIKDSTDFLLSGGKVHSEYDIEEDLWPVNIDTGQMSQVIQNIIINAMHVMPGGGKVNITCNNVSNEDGRIATLSRGNYVRVSIKDHGPGIPHELLDKVFDPYFTTKEGGSGLGLALTHSIITKHQGQIDVQTDSSGTDFIIYLPAMPGQSIEEKAEVAKMGSRPIRGNILIMDDEVMIRDIAGDLLTHLGFEVSTVSNGKEALELYSEKMNSDSPFDAVIMDLTIPGGMGGKEAIQKLLEIDPHVKGIVSSGYSNDPVMAEYDKYGFIGMVHKPFEIEELISTLQTVIGSEQNTDPSV